MADGREQTPVDRLLEFMDFFMALGDMKYVDMLVAVDERDPDFAAYAGTVPEPIETLLDLFRLYGKWAVGKIQDECGAEWGTTLESCRACERYRVMTMQWQGMLLWEGLEKIVAGK